VIDQTDIDLCLHELAHGLRQAQEGAAVITITSHDDGYWQCTGYTIERGGLEPMADTCQCLAAGPAFTVALDRRFQEMETVEKLKNPVHALLATVAIGVAENDLERIEALPANEKDAKTLAHAMRYWMMIAMAQEPAWRALAEHAAHEVVATGKFTMIGAHLRAMLDGTDILGQMASIPGMFVTEDSLAQIAKDVPTMCPQLGADEVVPLLSASVTTGPTGAEVVLRN